MPRRITFGTALPLLVICTLLSLSGSAHAAKPITAGGGRVCQSTTCLRHALAWQRKDRRHLRHELAVKFAPTEAYACALGQAAFGVPAAHCAKVIGCESGGDTRQVTLPTYASGLGQFEPGTWRGTPFGRFSVFDPIANVLAMDQIAAREGFDTGYGWAASYHCHGLSGPEG